MKLPIIFLTLLTLISSTIVCMEEENDSELNAALALSLQTHSNSNNNNNNNASINHFDSLPDELVLKIANEVAQLDKTAQKATCPNEYKKMMAEMVGFLLTCKRFNGFNLDIAKSFIQSYLKKRTAQNDHPSREMAAAKFNVFPAMASYIAENPEIVHNKYDHYDDTLLLAAVWSPSLETARVLLENGAHVDVRRNHMGSTPLMMAMMNMSEFGHNPLQIVELLVKEFDADVNLQNNEGNTALMYAVRFKKPLEVLQFLLESGADVTITDNNGNTVFDYARIYNDVAMVEDLLQQYAPTPNEQTNNE